MSTPAERPPRLKAIVLAMSYGSWGGGYPVSMIGPLLEEACSSGKCGLDALYVTVCFPSWGPAGPPFEGPSPFAEQFLGLPKVRWERGRRRLSVRYESLAGPRDELAGGRPPSAAAPSHHRRAGGGHPERPASSPEE